MKEMQTDVSLRVEDTETTDAFRVSGRGELHLSILIETMRRQGYEFQVTKPVVLYKEIDGVQCEPIERVVCDVPTEYSGVVIESWAGGAARLPACTGRTACAWNSSSPRAGCLATAAISSPTRTARA